MVNEKRSNTMTLTSMYKLSNPDPDIVQAQKAKIAQIIEQMGDKYLLAKPVPRKDAGSKK